MTEEHLRQLIAAGEGPEVEFKRELTPAIDRTIAAFANGNGGIILIGVDDDSSLVGVSDSQRQVEERVQGLCRSNVKPPVAPRVHALTLDSTLIGVVEVAPGLQKPYTAGDICYVRAGSTTRRARPEELRVLSFDTAFAQYERTPIADATLEDLDLAKLQAYIEKRAPGSILVNGLRLSDVAASWGLVRKTADVAIPTVAGFILFGLHPQWLCPQWGLGAIRLAGTELTDAIADRADLEGTTEHLIEGALAFVQRNMRIAGIFKESDPTQRFDVPEYPLAAIREAITNAVVHRDYSVNSRVVLQMFTDRLEIANPGGLPGGLTLEEVTARGGTSLPRNPTIARVMREWGKMEEVGRGFLRIRREMQALGSESPIFEAGPHGFKVILPSRHRTIPELQG